MAFLGLRVPPETARLLNEIEVPGTKEPVSSFHVTLLYIGSDVPIETLAEAMKATYEVTSKTRPFTVQTNRVTCFPKNANDDGKCPVICRIDSDPLHDLQSKLRASFDANGVPYSKKFPEYKPHLTLSYGNEEIEERRIPTVSWGAHECVLWGGDSGDNRLVMHFPFSLDTSHEIAERVVQRFAHSQPPLPGKFKGGERPP